MWEDGHVELLGKFNIDCYTAQHLTGGEIIQTRSMSEIYRGVVFKGDEDEPFCTRCLDNLKKNTENEDNA